MNILRNIVEERHITFMWQGSAFHYNYIEFIKRQNFRL